MCCVSTNRPRGWAPKKAKVQPITGNLGSGFAGRNKKFAVAIAAGNR
jgi:hypothetical protein